MTTTQSFTAIGAMLVTGALAGVQAYDRGVGGSAAATAVSAVADARYRDITIPAGTILPITLDSYVASDTSRVEDAVKAHLRRAVVIAGVTAIPAGSPLVGHVTSVQRPGKVKGRGRVAFRFSRLSVSNERRDIRTSAVARRAPATKSEDATKIAVPAAGGAIVGALVGGKKGAAIGAAAGGGAGTAVVLSTRGRDVRLGRGAIASVRLLEPLTVRVRD